MKIALVSPASFPATQFGGIMFLVADIAKEATANNMKIGYMASIHIPIFSNPPIVTAVAHNVQIIPNIRKGK